MSLVADVVKITRTNSSPVGIWYVKENKKSSALESLLKSHKRKIFNTEGSTSPTKYKASWPSLLGHYLTR